MSLILTKSKRLDEILSRGLNIDITLSLESWRRGLLGESAELMQL